MSTPTCHAAARSLRRTTRISRSTWGYVGSSALHAALELGLPDRLAAGPKPVSELARETGTDEDALYRVLRVLASLGLFEERAPRTFAANLPAQLLRAQPGTARDIVYFLTDPTHFGSRRTAAHCAPASRRSRR